jgi:hypothetical protein
MNVDADSSVTVGVREFCGQCADMSVLPTELYRRFSMVANRDELSLGLSAEC